MPNSSNTQEFWDQITGLFHSKLHDRAFELIKQELTVQTDHPKLKHYAARALGAKVEHALNLADQLHIKPDTKLIKEYLEKAITYDENLADLYWDIAVINARFENDFESAKTYLDKALALGFQHHLIPRLKDMIQKGLSAEIETLQPWSQLSKGKHELHLLIWRLVLWPDRAHPEFDKLKPKSRSEKTMTFYEEDLIFNSYCLKVIDLIRKGIVKNDDLNETLGIVGLFNLDEAEYAADLLRIAAEQLNDETIWKAAVEAHIHILVEMSFLSRGRVDEDDIWMKRARRTAKKAIDIVESLPFEIESNLHAELFIAYGQTFAQPEYYNLKVCVEYYLKALDYKEKVGNTADIKKLKELISRILDFEIKQAVAASLGFGKLGSSLEDLEIGFTAAKRIGKKALILRVAEFLSTSYRNVNQPQYAIELNEELLTYDWLNEEDKDRVSFELASGYSEVRESEKALEIQNGLIAKGEKLTKSINRATLWMNTGNSLRLTGNIKKAKTAFKKALSLVEPVKGNAIPIKEAQITTLLGDIECKSGDYNKGISYIKKAEKHLQNMPPSIQALHFHSIAAKCYYLAHNLDGCAKHVEKFQYNLEWNLSKGPTLPVWESMLQQWSHLDDYEVELHLIQRKKEKVKAAMIASERAKGRLLAWMRNYYDRDAARNALNKERIEKSFLETEKWVNKKKGRVLLSIYAAKKGLGIMALMYGDRHVSKWIDEFDFDDFRENYFLQWEKLVEVNMSGHIKTWEEARIISEYILNKVGDWLWRAVPELMKGGKELIILPHRFFRCLPISYAILPGGESLSELFEQVSIMPNLYDVAAHLEVTVKPIKTSEVNALADPDGTLPLARIEALSAAKIKNVKVGKEVTVDEIRTSIQSAPIVLIASHGDFDEKNPWKSKIFTYDGAFGIDDSLSLQRSIKTKLLVLSSCEIGKSRRSWSDEPIAFPTLFQQSGISTVVAPLWKVDDFGSMIFMTKFFELLKDHRPVAKALAESAFWLRTLTCDQAINYTENLLKSIKAQKSKLTNEVIKLAESDIHKLIRVLSNRPSYDRYFRSPLYWAQYVIYGIPSMDINKELKNA